MTANAPESSSDSNPESSSDSSPLPQNVGALNHAVVSHHLAILRDVGTPPEAFRAAAKRLTYFLVSEATDQLSTHPTPVTTPLEKIEGAALSGRIGLVPILRAGLGMTEAALDLLPMAEVWHLGLYRDEATFEPVEYYQKLPDGQPVDTAIILDPMLATGGSAIATIEVLKRWGVKNIQMLVLIAAPEGLKAVTDAHPDCAITAAAIDDHLNEKAYIVPGLGDAGDRIFNTQK